MGWAILDSREDNEHTPHEVVRTNIENAKKFYKRTQSEETVDPTLNNFGQRVTLQQGEALHIHAHGHSQGLGGFSAASLATLARAKFGNKGLKGRTIVLHGCNVGSGTFLKDFLRNLADNNLGGWDGTRVFGPTNYLIVNEEGISLVARSGVKAEHLKTRSGQAGKVQKKGVGWKGVTVKNGLIKDIPEGEELRVAVIHAMKKKG